MKDLLIFAGRTIACMTLIMATVGLFFLACITSGAIAGAACIGSVIAFIGAMACCITDNEKEAPKAQTRSEYNTHTTTAKTA